MLGLHDVRHAALAGLRVDPDDGLVGAAHVVRVDRQVGRLPLHLGHGDPPLGGLLVQVLQALLDGVLVGAGEGGVDQISRVRVARVDRQVGAVLHRATDLVDVGEVDLRVDALGEQVHAQGDQVDVAGPLAVTEQAALDPVGAGHHGQLGGGDGGAAVVVRVQRDGHVVAVADLATEPLDQVRVRVRRGHLHRGRQVQDDLATLCGLPDVHHRVADLHGEVRLGAGEDLRGVLVAELDVTQVLLGVLHHQLGAVGGDRHALGLVDPEHDPPEQGRGRVVHVDRRALGAHQGLRGALDQVLTGLGQHRHRDVVGDLVALDQLTDEVEVGLAGRREADLDLLVAHAHQQVEHLVLAGRGHRVDQGLVAVPEIGAQPSWGSLDPLAGPGAVRQVDAGVRAVALEGHRARLLGGHGLNPRAEGGAGSGAGHRFLAAGAGCRTGRTTNSAARAPALVGPAAAAKEEQSACQAGTLEASHAVTITQPPRVVEGCQSR